MMIHFILVHGIQTHTVSYSLRKRNNFFLVRSSWCSSCNYQHLQHMRERHKERESHPGSPKVIRISLSSKIIFNSLSCFSLSLCLSLSLSYVVSVGSYNLSIIEFLGQTLCFRLAMKNDHFFFAEIHKFSRS